MRLQNKYKKFTKLDFVFKEFPTKIIKFHRTKWKKIQNLVLKKEKKNRLWSIKALMSLKRWMQYRTKYADSVKLKRSFDCLFDRSFSMLFLKKLKYLNKKLNLLLEYCIYLIRPEFRLDIFLWRLNFFSSPYESRRYINNNQIQINNQKTYPNYFLKKGDIISFNYNNYYDNLTFFSLLSTKLNKNKILTFIEIDYYTNSVIVLKNYDELIDSEIIFFTSNFCNISKLKLYIK